MKTVISFPGLGIESLDLNRVLFPLFGGLEVRTYGVFIVLGLVLALLYAVLRGRGRDQIRAGAVADVWLLSVICGVIGARAFYVMSTWSVVEYETFWDVIAIRIGELPLYGALIGGCVGVLIGCLWKRVPVCRMLDIAAPAVLLGQAVGLVGNLFEGAAHGTVIAEETAASFFGRTVMLPSGEGTLFHALRMELAEVGTWEAYHPLFLYEWVWVVLGFVLLSVLSRHKRFHGQIALTYAAWYGFGRMLIEAFRYDSLYWSDSTLRMSQLVGAVSFLFAAIALTVLLIRNRGRDPYAPTPVPHADDRTWKNKENNRFSRSMEHVLSRHAKKHRTDVQKQSQEDLKHGKQN
ncbi:MAG: prolipoprotein diacylglyceryl transferase [Clostridia bacterium]|nr:prolipoprotein diacylglyceryl transferase [Clostridia bacterium]MBQ9774346.1 prolipoprotein diacylglyceryl transferase [Clostridia bacterium]